MKHCFHRDPYQVSTGNPDTDVTAYHCCFCGTHGTQRRTRVAAAGHGQYLREAPTYVVGPVDKTDEECPERPT